MMWSYIISCWKMGSICCGNHLPGWILPRSYAPRSIAKNLPRLQESSLHYSARPKSKKRRATRPGKEFNTQLLEKFQHPQQNRSWSQADVKQINVPILQSEVQNQPESRESRG